MVFLVASLPNYAKGRSILPRVYHITANSFYEAACILREAHPGIRVYVPAGYEGPDPNRIEEKLVPALQHVLHDEELN